jgi:hypothetical protein
MKILKQQRNNEATPLSIRIILYLACGVGKYPHGNFQCFLFLLGTVYYFPVHFSGKYWFSSLVAHFICLASFPQSHEAYSVLAFRIYPIAHYYLDKLSRHLYFLPAF